MVADQHGRGHRRPPCGRREVEPNASARHGLPGKPQQGRAERTSDDRMILAQLRFLGIEKGKPFNPDIRQKKILEEAVLVGEAMAKANTPDNRVEPPFWPGTNWKHALVVSVNQRMPGYDQLDERAAWFYEAIAVSKGMLTQTPGVGQRYIAAYKDRDGNWLTGGKTC